MIRDKVGLDRYGATNPTYGKQVTASGNKYASTYGWVTLGENGKIDESAADTLKENNYTVAYVPGDVRDNVGYSARETQGYTNSIIERNRKTNQVSGNKETTTVSQVNEGQITEYPYNLNESLTIKTTHSQYYQLNMNADDVVVWYCLGGTKFADEKNDATNAYYIYNRGNITYSGAGHTASGLSDDESKLFVNTMIAAYRAGAGAAGVSFRTAADDEASVLLFPVQSHMEEIEENGVKKSVKVTESLSSEQTTFFKITNSNLKTDNTTMSVKLYYEVPAGTTGAVSATTLGVTISHDETTNANLYMKEVSLLSNSIRHADNGDPASANNLSSDVLYKMAIPSEVLNYMAGVEGDGKLYLVGTTVITSDAGTNTYKSFDALTLKQLGLLRLE